MKTNTGYILHETKKVVIIATTKTSNRKTGNMVQLWILNRDESPLDSIKSGSDANVCFNCPARGINGKQRTCYVDLGRAPMAIWRKYARHGYAFLPTSDYASVFGGRKVRFGAYGEPILIPLSIMEAIKSYSIGHTGYTHQWRKPSVQGYRASLMASCDSVAEQLQATAMGWRTFRARASYEPLIAGEISCPASDEAGKKSTCEKCRLCDGSRTNDARKNISIIVHGIGAKNFVSLTAIGGSN
jgi:hypothetical protein